MAYLPLINVVPQFFDNLGDPLVGGTLNAYIAGTSTPTNMFSDNTGTVAGTSVTLDSRGEPTTIKLIWLDTDVSYKFILKDSTGATIWTEDNIQVTSVQDGSITEDKIAAGAVTTSKIATSAVTTSRLADGAVTTTKISDNSVTYQKLKNSGYELGTRNKIINGKMQVSQRDDRGSPFAAPSGYSLDRWRVGSVTTGSINITVIKLSINTNGFANALRLYPSTADTSIGSTEYVLIEQRIEGRDIVDLINTTFTLSFWVKAVKTGTYCISFRNNGNDRSYVAEYTINAASTWEYKTITVTDGLITAGSWNYTSLIGLSVSFIIAAGSSFHTTAGAWQTGQFYSTSNQVNGVDNTANWFEITGVQLEKGSSATPFEHLSYAQDLSLCQRYFEYGLQASLGLWSSIANGYPSKAYAVVKRAQPTVTLIPSSGTGATVQSTIMAFTQTVAHSAVVLSEWTSDAEL